MYFLNNTNIPPNTIATFEGHKGILTHENGKFKLTMTSKDCLYKFVTGKSFNFYKMTFPLNFLIELFKAVIDSKSK